MAPARRLGGSSSLFISFPPCHGRTGADTPSGTLLGEDHAFIHILGQEPELNGEGENVARAGDPPSRLCWGQGVP